MRMHYLTKQYGRAVTVLLLALLGIVVGAYFTGALQRLGVPPIDSEVVNVGVTEKNQHTKDVAIRSPIDELDFAYAFPYDKSISLGLKLAIELYVKKFLVAPGENPDINVDVVASQLDTEWYEIEYQVRSVNLEEKYILKLSNQPRKLEENILQAKTVLDEFIKRHPVVNHALVEMQSADLIKFEVSKFDHSNMFSLLEEHSQSFEKNGSLDDLHAASQIFSWLAVLKSKNKNQSLKDVLAVRSAAIYFLAESLSTSKVENKFTKGLLYLGMDYPAMAEKVLGSIQDPKPFVSSMIAYIQRRSDLLSEYIKEGSMDNKIGYYLLARTYIGNGQRDHANEEFNFIIGHYSKFLHGMEFVLDEAEVGIKNRRMDWYVENLLATHFDVLKNYTNTDWIEGDIELQALMQQASVKSDAITKWLKVHGKLTEQTKISKKPTLLLEGNFVAQYLREEMLDAIIIDHKYKAGTLGSRSQSQRVIDNVTAAYPNEDVSKALYVQQLMNNNNEKVLLGHLKKLGWSGHSKYLLSKLLDGHGRYTVYWPRYPQIIPLMREFKNSISPNKYGLVRLSRIYYKFYYDPYQLAAIKAGIEIDPYDYWSYHLARKTAEGAEIFASGNSVIDYSYGYFYRYANWLVSIDKQDEAIQYYEKAIEFAPYEDDSYAELGDVYYEKKKYPLALSTWQKYIDTGDRSLRAVNIRNKIAKLYLKTEQYQKAYDLYQKEGKSGQNAALVNFAKASEKIGKTSLAEEYFISAAKRYTSGWSSAQLALFYWRQGDTISSINTLKSSKRFAKKYFYHDSIIKYFKEIDRIDDAISILQEVESDNKDYFAHMYFAKKLEKEGYWESAQKVMEPILSAVYADDPERAFYFATYYYQLFEKYFPQAKHLALEKIYSIYGNDNLNMYFTSITFNRMGFFDAALDASKKVNKSNGKVYGSALQSMGLAWSLGSRSELAKKEIEDKISELPKGSWHRWHIDYLLGNMERDEIVRRAYAYSKVAECEIFHDLGMQHLEKNNTELGIKYMLATFETNSASCGYRAWAFEILESM